MVHCPPDLKKAYAEGRVLPFIGAGVSMAVNWTEGDDEKRGPSWSELVDEATKLLGFEDPRLARFRATDLQILEYFKARNAGQVAKLTNWLTTINPPDYALQRSQIHIKLAELGKCHLYYTTNFDNFLERALKLLGRTPNVVAVEAHMGLRKSDCEVVKFHGDLDNPDHIVLTELEYEARLSLSTPMDYKLMGDLLGRVVLFIGYSFRDPNVSYLFRLFNEEIMKNKGILSGNRAFIFVSDPSDFEHKLFSERDITIIPVSGGSMSDDIASVLEDMRS